MLLAASLVGGVRYPVSVAAFGLLWMKARFAWAKVWACVGGGKESCFPR